MQKRVASVVVVFLLVELRDLIRSDSNSSFDNLLSPAVLL